MFRSRDGLIAAPRAHTVSIEQTRLKLRVASDGMTVAATVSAGRAAGMTELRQALTHAKVVSVEDPELLVAFAKELEDPTFTVTDRIIGRGRPAQPGEDGYFEPAFDVGVQPGRVGPDGLMDFFDRALLKAFAQGDQVGRLHRPREGVVGLRLDGSEIKVAAVRPSKLRISSNLIVADDGQVFAAREGVVLYKVEESLDIVQQHVHTGDVDLRSGSLDMLGALVVRGTIQRRFHARASGDVEIQGAVDSGSAYAGGSLRVRDGVRGGESGMVCAEGDVSARYAEAAHVLAGGLLKIETAINSELAAARIEIARSVRGGSAHAETSLVAQEAGLAHGTGTLLAAGVPLTRPVLDVRRAVAAVKDQRAHQHRAGGVRNDGERHKGGKEARAALGLQRDELARKTALAERRHALVDTAFVHLGTGHAGVVVQIGVHSTVLHETVRNTRFSYDAETRAVRAERSGR